MALNLQALTPEPTQMTRATGAGRKAKDPNENPFIANGWLKKSHDDNQAYGVTVDTSEAHTVLSLIRGAATYLKIGCSTDVTDGKPPKTEKRLVYGKVEGNEDLRAWFYRDSGTAYNGKTVKVKYQGKEFTPRPRKPRDTDVPPVEGPQSDDNRDANATLEAAGL